MKKLAITGFVSMILLMFANPLFASKIEVDDQFDFKLAMDFAFNNMIDSLVLVTDGGVYTTTDTVYFQVKHPLTIVAAPGLTNKPILTHSDANGTQLEIFRVHNDFVVEGVVFDGGHPATHGMKYAIRVGEGPDGFPQPKVGLNVTIRNCDFVNFYEDKDLSKDGHGFYFLTGVDAGTIRIEDCSFANTGYEAIRISETEKYPIDRALDSLIVRNCTFTNIDAECIRFYADLDTSTQDAYALFENLTVNASATRMMFVKNNRGTIARNILVTNSRESGHGRDDYVLQIQELGSVVSHIDTFNVNSFTAPEPGSGRISATKGGTVDSSTVYGYDPNYADPGNLDYTLANNSQVCNKGFGGVAISDQRWAGNCDAVGIDDDRFNTPVEFYLRQNYPNPFNPGTVISYFLPKNGAVVLRVFDITGAEVTTLVNEIQSAGEQQVTYDASGLTSGVYFYRLDVNGVTSETRKMMLLK